MRVESRNVAALRCDLAPGEWIEDHFRTLAVQEHLAGAIEEIGRFIGRPHFKTKVGKKFGLEEIAAALAFSDPTGGKAILCP